MAVQEQTPYIEHIANGVTTSFALEFECKDKEHLIVLVDNVEPNVGTWSLENGVVVFGIAPADGKIISIQRNTPFRRDTNFQSYDNSLRPATINKDFDWIWFKLQELGVANWLLKNYVDRKDDELKAYLLEEIHKQGVALDQLDDYYNYLMQRLAQIAVDKGWDASFVVDGSMTQRQINDGLESITQMLEIPSPRNNQRIYVKETDSFYVYDSSNTTPVSLDGWVLQHDRIVSTVSLGIEIGADITELLSYAVDNNLSVHLPDDTKYTTTVFNLATQASLVGNGSVQHVYDYLSNNNTEHVAPKIANPYPPKGNGNNYGWYDSVEARGNFEHGSGYGLIVNDKTRPQVCGFRTKQQQKNYPSVDMVGLYTHVASPRSVFLSNCTFTSNTVSSLDLTNEMDIRVGDFIRTARDPAIGMPWRSEITSIDYATKTLGVTWWLHESGSGEGTPPDGLTCEAPYTNGLWGHNTNVFLYSDRPAHRIIGYELGVYSEKTRDKFTSMDGYYAVNLTTQTARAQHAFMTGGTWDKGLGAYNCIDAVYTDGTTKNGLNFAPTADANSTAIRYDLNTRKTGNIVQSVAGVDTFFSMSALGVVSHNRQDYKVSSASDTHTALSPTLVLGANATAAHTTTIDTSYMPAKTILTFRQFDAVNWTIVAGSSSFVLNTSGAMDYLQLFYDGSGFLKLFAGKSL